MPNIVPSPSIFLDTNAIHNIASYLIQAEKLRLPPFQTRGNLETVKVILKDSLTDNMADVLINGLRILAFLQNQVEQSDARIYSSRIAIAELWYGRLDGQAHIRMALDGVPYRQRQRQSDMSVLVLNRLTQSDYELVNGELNNIIEDWYSKFGLEVMLIEDHGTPNSRDISLLAIEIQKITFLDVIDCLLFSSSLAVLATDFITSDAHLFDVINKIKNPNNINDPDKKALWVAAQKKIIHQLRALHLNQKITTNYLCVPHKPQKLGNNISNLHLL